MQSIQNCKAQMEEGINLYPNIWLQYSQKGNYLIKHSCIGTTLDLVIWAHLIGLIHWVGLTQWIDLHLYTPLKLWMEECEHRCDRACSETSNLGSSGIISSSYFRGYSSRTPLTCTSPPSQQIHRKSYEFPRILSILMKVIQNAPFQHEYAINLHFHRSKNIFSSIHLFLSWIMTHASQFLKF